MVSILTFHNLDTGWPWIPQRLINTFPAGRRVCSLVWIVWVCYLWFPLQVFLIPFLVTCQVYENHQKYLHVCVGFGSNEDYNPRTLQCNFTKMYNVETVHYFQKKFLLFMSKKLRVSMTSFLGCSCQRCAAQCLGVICVMLGNAVR